MYYSQPVDYFSTGNSAGGGGASGSHLFDSLTRFVGLSFFASFFAGSGSNAYDAIRMFLLGSIIETGRRLFYWVIDRFKMRYCITAEIHDGDPAYEWVVNFLTQQDVWRHSKDFVVSARSSQLRWAISLQSGKSAGMVDKAEYVPKYDKPHLFRWRGCWVEIQQQFSSSSMNAFNAGPVPPLPGSSIILTLYTLNLAALSEFVTDAHRHYIEGRRSHVIIHTSDSSGNVWGFVKRKNRRPLTSIVLPSGVLDGIVQDIKDFLQSEQWYTQAGIPYRRGYLLYGPPGTGKTSTIYAIAGELGLEIYSLSLSSGYVDDNLLQRAVSALPKHSIFLLEDIDCAFLSRDEEEEMMRDMQRGHFGGSRKSNVTMSGLLNILDGVGSEDGKLFFATTNYVDRLDTALIRPGRVDVKVEYKLATKSQALELFHRFYPQSTYDSNEEKKDEVYDLKTLGASFAAQIPEDEFTTAELQGYLLSHRKDPEEAVNGVQKWIEKEREERKRRKEVEEKEKAMKGERALKQTRYNGDNILSVA
ncbi:hypothetical protein AX17_003800 [Amanita inopinata Kibby_2008]|nr:hypothetical protein AX17_003800 [Amanita inopinata Kibby_2008]